MIPRAPAALLALALSGCFLTYDENDVDRPRAIAAPGTLAVGEACLLAIECGSGACAPEGICCNRDCSGECEACNGVDTGQPVGTCGTLAAGMQPHSGHGACTTDGSACGGSCNGTLATCAYPIAQCRNQSCTGSTQDNATSCDGAGHCPPASTTSCGTYACGGIGCRNSCVLDTACSAGNWCDAGSCVPKIAQGGPCTASNQCQTGACAPDGTCCDRGCTGQCEACNGVNTGAAAGTCGTITAGNQPQPGHAACASDGSACGGSCNGTLASACAYPTLPCRSASCSAGTQTAAASCSGGSCPSAVTQPCTPFVCGPTACKTSCAGDADCVAFDYCAAPSCLQKKALATACASNNECATGNCVDSVCCDSTAAACNGCNACNVSGKVGTCWPVPAGSDPHDACTVASCQTTCNGSGACGTVTAAADQICASAGCVNELPDAFGRPAKTTASVARCGGAAQVCPGLTSGSSCGTFTCSGASCATQCVNNDGCVSETLCVGGACQHCSTDADCGRFAPLCMDGMCQCWGDPWCAESYCSGPADCTSGGWGDACVGAYWECACTPGVSKCNGRAPRCMGTAPNGWCGQCGSTNNLECLVGQLCTTADTSGVCKVAPAFHCSTGTDCASGTCTGGFCTKLPAGRPCAHDADCANGTCTASWLCN